jgi:glucokinase
VSPAFVGVDLGGTKIAVAALTVGGEPEDATTPLGCDRGELGESVVRPTDLSSSDALIDQLVDLVEEVKPGRVDAVGIGVPSVVEFRTGRVVSSVNVPLANIPLREVLSDRLGVPTFVDNDATVAALAEAHDENLRLVAHNLVILTVGTGVGGGLVLGGRIYRGATGGAGELGHTIVGLHLDGQDSVPTGAGFPQPGSLEHVAAGHALDRFAIETGKRYPDSALGRLEAEGTAPTGGDAVTAAVDGDREARRTVEVWAERVGIGIANAINTFDPDEVVIGGGAALAGELLLEPAVRVAQEYVHPGLAGHARIRLARHGVRAGVLGAALLALHEHEHAPAEDRRVMTEPASPEVS